MESFDFELCESKLYQQQPHRIAIPPSYQLSSFLLSLPRSVSLSHSSIALSLRSDTQHGRKTVLAVPCHDRLHSNQHRSVDTDVIEAVTLE